MAMTGSRILVLRLRRVSGVQVRCAAAAAAAAAPDSDAFHLQPFNAKHLAALGSHCCGVTCHPQPTNESSKPLQLMSSRT